MKYEWKINWAVRVVLALAMTFVGAFVMAPYSPELAIILVFGGLIFQVFNYVQMSWSVKKKEAQLVELEKQERLDKLEGLM